MNRVVHFEFAAQDPERAAEFYRKAFGWTTQRWEGPTPYWLVTTGSQDEPGINGAILRHPDGAPRTVNTIQVASIDDTIARVEQNGGKVMMPKMTIPGVGYVAYCTDTEGLVFGLHTADPGAQ